MSDREKEQYQIDILVGLAERTITKLWIIIAFLIVLLVGSNWLWYHYESQFVDTVQTVTQEVEQTTDGGGDNSFVGGDVYGSSESQNDYDNPDANP